MTQETQEAIPQQTEEEKSLSTFTSRAMRRPKTGSYEQLLCQHLITSVSTFSTEKIRLICEAAYMVPDTPVDTDILDIIYKVVMSFRSTEVKITDPERFPGAIAWGFSCNETNYKKYITPWLKRLSRLFTRGDYRNQKYEEKLEEIAKELENAEEGKEPYYKYFWHLTTHGAFHISGVEMLKAKFVNWAMPHTMRMFEQLTKLVNPNIYMELAERVKI